MAEEAVVPGVGGGEKIVHTYPLIRVSLHVSKWFVCLLFSTGAGYSQRQHINMSDLILDEWYGYGVYSISRYASSWNMVPTYLLRSLILIYYTEIIGWGVK